MREYESSSRATVEDHCAADKSLAAESRILARIPELGAEDAPTDATARRGRSDGRLLSQSLSTKLLAGGGALLLLAAVVPLFRGQKKEDASGPPLPAWHQGVPAPTADAAPAWPAVGPQRAEVQPFDPRMVPPPVFAAEQDPGGMAERRGAPMPDAPLTWDTYAPPVAPAARYSGQTMPSVQGPVEALTWPDPGRSPSDLGRSPAPTRTGSAEDRLPDMPATYPDAYEASRPGSIHTGASANRPLSVADRPPGPPTREQEGYRQALRFDHGRADWTDDSARVWLGPSAEPGTAQLQGIIEKPPLGTSHDVSRQGVH